MPDLNPIDLESHIRSWREGLITQEALSADDLEELEQHLRDSFGRLKAKDLSDEEAFLLAQRRLGAPAELAIEYAKVDGAPALTRRICWMLSGYLLIDLLIRGIGAASLLAQAGVFAFLGAEHLTVAAALSAVVWVACWVGALLHLFRSTKSSTTVFRWLEQLSGLGLASVVVSLLLTASAIRFAGALVMLRFSSPQEFGEVALVTAYAGPVISLLVPALVLGLLLSVRKRLKAEQAATA